MILKIEVEYYPDSIIHLLKIREIYVYWKYALIIVNIARTLITAVISDQSICF